MGKYNAYEKYKDSGIEWLGEIPEHWKRSIFRYYFDIQLGKMLQNEPQSENDEEISYLKAIHVRWNKVDTYDLPKMWASPKDKEKYYVKNGDLLICEGGEVGRTALLKDLQEDCIIQNALHRVRSLSQSNVKYLSYLMQHIADTGWLDILCNKSTISHLTSEKLSALPLPFPPLPEQQAIANFLDYKTKQIDALINKKETLLEKLGEKRTAIISHAVTKGLDPNVPMKDSGVEWLGEIPEHWEKKRLKFVVSKIIDAEHKTALYDDNGDYLVVRTANVRTGELLLENAKFTNESVYKEWTVRAVPEQGDILFTREAPAGEACLVPEKPIVCLGQRMVLFKFDKTKYNGYFLLQSLYSGIADEFIKSLSLGSTVAHFNMSDITSIPLFIPPYNEQKQIAEYLDQQTAKIDQQKLKIQQAIDRLKEYRTALITNAVTGKIDVRQVSIS
jgi:type I restriction enzyme S subunit